MLKEWVKQRYDTLWKAFGERAFTTQEAFETLKEKHNDTKAKVNVIISELRKAKYLNAESEEKDARKKIYRLKSPAEKIGEIFQINNQLTRSELETLLKKSADLIRTRVDYTFILILLFYKRISDKWQSEFQSAYKSALEDGLSEKEAKKEAQQSAYHDFDIPEEYLWDNIRKDPARLPENFSRALKTLAQRNPDLKEVFENVDFIQFTSSQENAEILRQLVELFSARSLAEVSSDILGDAYEWIIKYFAPQKAKEGEVFTPREVIRLIVEILEPKDGKPLSIYDPACGSGGMLIESYKFVENKSGKHEADKLFLYGQEVNQKTLALAKMNLYIHDIKNAQLMLGDTLLYPKFKNKKGDGIEQFDFVIANPPWNQDGYDEETLKKGDFWKDRFQYGFTPRQSADWTWIQHMLASAKDPDGKVGIVIDNGALFRGGKEKAIREQILKKDLIECVLLLPEKLFYNTGAPGAIIILNKNKAKNRKEKVLFINASKEFEQHPEVRKLNILSQENIKTIANAYKNFEEKQGFSKPVPLEEIKANDYNLNVTLYVFPEEEQEKIDVAKEWEELQKLERELKTVEGKLAEYLYALEILKEGV